MLLAVAKVTYVGVLAVFFLFFFGYPALQRYLERAVLIKVSTVSLEGENGGLLPPAITFCALTPRLPYSAGRKNSSGELHHVIEAECENLSNHIDIQKCIEEKTFKLDEILLGAVDGMVNPKNLLNKTFWTSYMTVTTYGNCYMLRYRQPFSADFEEHSIWLHLRSDLIYDVYFHDPNFFLITQNLMAIPKASIRKRKVPQADMEFDMYPLMVTERRNINRPSNPCVEELDYDFMACVTDSVVAKIGCRYPWDQNSGDTFPICTTLEKILELEELFFTIGKMERKDVISATGCQVPCRFREYKILNDLMKGVTSRFGIGMVFHSTEITLEEEDYVYPLVSFVAEFGGALGMFLGFSFLMVWDLLVMNVIRNMK